MTRAQAMTLRRLRAVARDAAVARQAFHLDVRWRWRGAGVGDGRLRPTSVDVRRQAALLLPCS